MNRVRFRLLSQSQLGQDSAHSLLISLLRGLAAVEVAAAHLRAACFPGLRDIASPTLGYQVLALATSFSHQAVVVFFVISGWLVGGSLLNKRDTPGAFAGYAVDRISRLWTVLLPTFFMMICIGLFTEELRPGPIDFSRANDFSATTLVGNLLGLQTITVDKFGGNFPLWSLANETWYYLMFPLLVVCAGRGPAPARLAGGAALAGVVLALPYAMSIYFLVWLMGAIFSRIKFEGGPVLRALLLLGVLAAAAGARLYGSNDDLSADTFAQDFVFGLAVLLFLSSMQVKLDPLAWPMARARAVAQFFAEFSFTLYVFHVPLIGLMGYVLDTLVGSHRLVAGSVAGYLIYLAMSGVLLAASYISYLAFESHTPSVRRWLKGMMLPQALRQL
jgi:peptidoglycan/LPS O-acetylase OafA/YrhL